MSDTRNNSSGKSVVNSMQSLTLSDVDWYTKRRYDVPHRYYSSDGEEEDGGVDPTLLADLIGEARNDGRRNATYGGYVYHGPESVVDARQDGPNSIDGRHTYNGRHSSVGPLPTKETRPTRRRPQPMASSAAPSAGSCAIMLNVAIKQPHHAHPPRHHKPHHAPASNNQRKARRQPQPEPTSPEITCLGRVRMRRRKGLNQEVLATNDGLTNGKTVISGPDNGHEDGNVRSGRSIKSRVLRLKHQLVSADDNLSTKMDLCIVRGNGLMRGISVNQVADQTGLESNGGSRKTTLMEKSEASGGTQWTGDRMGDGTAIAGDTIREKKMGDWPTIKVGATREKNIGDGAAIKAGMIREKAADRGSIKKESSSIPMAEEKIDGDGCGKRAADIGSNRACAAVEVDFSVIDLSRFGSKGGRDGGAGMIGARGGGVESGGDAAAPPRNSLLLMRRSSRCQAVEDPEEPITSGDKNPCDKDQEVENGWRMINSSTTPPPPPASRLWQRRSIAEPASIDVMPSMMMIMMRPSRHVQSSV